MVGVRDRPSKFSQSGRILKVLEDYRDFDWDEGWVSTHELIYGHGIPGIIHSRISELRRDYGFAIEHRRTKDKGAKGHQYRLTQQEPEVSPERPAPGATAPFVPLPASGVETAAAPEALFPDERTHYARETAA